MGQTPSSTLKSDYYNLKKTICQIGDWGGRNSEILVISNRYKNTYNDLIDSPYTKS